MSDSVLQAGQRRTLGSLFAGYAGYYICRSNLSVAIPLLLVEFSKQGLNKSTLGLVMTAGALCYAVGKLFNGILSDFIGGRGMFLCGMAGSILCTLLFGRLAGLGAFAALWSLNLLFQSMGWGALVKIVSSWFPFERYGRVMGTLSLSFLVGDGVARFLLGGLLAASWGWREIFYAAAGALAAIAVVVAGTLKSSPGEIGASEPEAHPRNLFSGDGAFEGPASVGELMRPLLKSEAFRTAAFLSFGLTLIRESFSLWTPTYLMETAHLSAGAAAQFSLVYPLFGGLSVLAAGHLTDGVAGGRRGGIMAGSFTLLAATLLGMSAFRLDGSALIPMALVSGVALFLFGPYCFLEGAIPLDLGGKRGSSTASGMIGSMGYLGAMAAGCGVGTIAERSGWPAAFGLLAGVAALSAGAALSYGLRQERGELTCRDA